MRDSNVSVSAPKVMLTVTTYLRADGARIMVYKWHKQGVHETYIRRMDLDPLIEGQEIDFLLLA